jgi:hypothetical protein
MKKIKVLSLVLVAFVGLFSLSCETEPVIEENEIANGTQTFVYSIQVKQSSLTSGRVKGLAGVNVTVNQNGGVQTKTTDATGIVSFDNMKQGAVSVFVQAPEGFSSINTNDYLDCQLCDITELDVDQLEYQQLTVELPKQGATLQGKVFADVDFSGQVGTGETLPNTAVVIAKVSNDYEPNVYKVNVQSDGTFKFTDLPEGISVDISLDFKKNDTGTPVAERTFYFDDLGPYVLDVNNPTSIGNVTASYF